MKSNYSIYIGAYCTLTANETSMLRRSMSLFDLRPRSLLFQLFKYGLQINFVDESQISYKYSRTSIARTPLEP